jgi:hypothetical protein
MYMIDLAKKIKNVSQDAEAEMKTHQKIMQKVSLVLRI